MGRRLALLIATYEHEDAGLRQLTAPGHDAEALGDTLRDAEIAGFEVTTLVNEPHYVVGRAIGELCRDRRREDLVLLYFTGHGLKDDAGRLHLATVDTRRDNLAFTSLPADLVDRALSDCVSRQQVLILDCCYGGAFPAGGLTKADEDETHALERFRGRGRTVLTAADATQFSFESDGALRGGTARSVFTHHLVNGLREGTADLDGDGDITLDELYEYVHDKVVDEMPQQRPKRQDNVEGRIVIARNVRWTLPAHVRDALESPITSARLGAVDALAHLLRIGNPVVRARAVQELERLAADDSRMVSAAATRALPVARVPEEPPVAVADEPSVAQELAPDEPLVPEETVADAVPDAVAAPVPDAVAAPVAPDSAGVESIEGAWKDTIGGAVCAPLVVENGTLYVAGSDGHLSAYDAASGARRWRYTTGHPVQNPPVVLNGLVYVAARGTTIALDAVTGEVAWRHEGQARPVGAVAALAPWVFAVNGINLRCFYAADGHEKWRRTFGVSDLRWAVVVGDKLWCGNSGRHVYVTDAATGKKGFRLALRDSSSSARAVAEDGLFLHIAGGKDGDLYCVDAVTGQERWHFVTLSPVRCSPVVAGPLVYAGDAVGNLYAVETATGTVRWRVSVGTPLNASPAVAYGAVYVGGMDATVHVFDAATGERLGGVPTDGPVQTVPVVRNGLVHAGNDAGEILTFPVPGAGG
ncbi:PQQ-binding-like beta-propeller repeat protein [Streptomyces sp. NPDC008139]|uniref:caspase, EACC1-associated type n=1 Tax=Streptomyces sp. NPDC008139 TaxID=3364814 RepID=UPI0036EA06D8